ncbi:MAG: radical SAM protein [Nanoarchaeota archaeon]|nr:radical SAM protein [Nanoarchaeota archaeon]
MKGKIVYRFETPVYPANILYVNLIASYSCVNDCLFCSRPRDEKQIGKPNIYERKAGSFLFLPQNPSIDKVMGSIESEIRQDDSELAIIGLGEPLIYLPKVVEVIRRVKERYGIRTRVDTNGLVKCMYDDPADRLREAGLDEIRISLNAINEPEYEMLCQPKLTNAFPNLIGFVRECVDSGIDTYVSFVVGFERERIRKRTKEEYARFAESLGIRPDHIILRVYVEPLR